VNEILRKLLVLPPQASTISSKIDALHFFVIGVTMLGALTVAAVAIYFSVKYRERPGAPVKEAKSLPRKFEIAAFGGVLSLFLLWWVIGFHQYVTISRPPSNAETIYVTGKQWMWSFAYPNGAASESVLYVPVGRPVKLVMTSRDMIHSFYVPAFRLKRDVIPGRTTTMWFEATMPGRYPVYCAEYCGAQHSTMRAEVVVLPDNELARQLGRLTDGTSLASQGELVAARAGCMRCHTPDGTPHLGPTWAGLYGSTVTLETGRQVVVDDAYLTKSMMDPMADIHAGFQRLMPTYQGVLGAADIGAIVEYIRSLRDVKGSAP
jgi:cytochrome c oxidase subunit 2